MGSEAGVGERPQLPGAGRLVWVLPTPAVSTVRSSCPRLGLCICSELSATLPARVGRAAAAQPGDFQTTFLSPGSSFIPGLVHKSGLSVMATYQNSFFFFFLNCDLMLSFIFYLIAQLDFGAFFCLWCATDSWREKDFASQKIRLQGHGYVQFDLADVFTRTRV